MKDMELGQVLKIIFQSVYKRLKMSKKEGQFFVASCYFIWVGRKVGRKSRHFMPVKGLAFKKMFIFK